MGATFGNIQILNKEKLTKEEFVNKFVKGFEDLDFELSKDNQGDLEIIIFYHPTNKWVCLYNEALDQVSEKDLKKQASMYKDIFNTDVIASSVFDSDVIFMRLDGSKKDMYIHDLHEAYGYDNNASKGSIKKWSHLIEPQYTENDLIQIWNDDFIFAEEKLASIGKILGFDDRISSEGYGGYPYLDQEVLAQYEVIELSFMNKRKPYHLIYQDGLPRLEFTGGPGLIQYDESAAFDFYSRGGESKGFDIILYGELIDNKAFNFEPIKITKNFLKFYSNDDVIAEAPLVEAKLVNGSNVLVASFNDFPIPRGFKVEYDEDIRRKIGMSHAKLSDEIRNLEGKIRTIFRIRALSEQKASGKLYVFAVPHENRPGFAQHGCTVSNDKSYIDEHLRIDFDDTDDIDE